MVHTHHMLPIIAAKHLIIASNGSSLSYLHKRKKREFTYQISRTNCSVMCHIQWQQRSEVNAGHGLLIMTGKKTMLSVAFFH
jgi:hypothetical protein